jgi:carbonic anhydrase
MCVMLASFSPAAAAPEPAAGALTRLKAGNDRFVRGTQAASPSAASSRAALAAGTVPFAMVLSCADQRLAAEHVFGAGPGDLYTVRSLGEVVDKVVVASLEHGVARLRLPLLVVMGHESCDAVKAAHSDQHGESDSLEHLYKAIRAGAPRSAGDQHDLRAAILANVEQVINDVLGGSAVLRAASAAGRLQIVGAYFDMSTGAVVFSEPVGATSPATHQ